MLKSSQYVKESNGPGATSDQDWIGTVQPVAQTPIFQRDLNRLARARAYYQILERGGHISC
jgi:hypothetical protein